MQRSRSTWTLRALTAAGILPLLLGPARADTTCRKDDLSLPCRSTTIFSVYTGSPTVPCSPGHPVVRISSTARCMGQQAGPAVVLRCGVESTPFSYSGGSYTHTFETLSSWETILNGNCNHLVYTPTQS